MGGSTINLILLGPPGCGKGTQAKRVCEAYGIPQVATGDILRVARSVGTPFGREAQTYMYRGELVPDNIVIAIVLERLEKPDCLDGFVLDGYPRTLPQASALEASLKSTGRAVDQVVAIGVPPEVLVTRTVGRRSCETCGTPFHVRYSPPKREGVCDRCGGALAQRQDDTEDVARARLQVYEAQTAPLIAHYRELGVLTEVDGTGGPDDVFQSIRQVLGEPPAPRVR